MHAPGASYSLKDAALRAGACMSRSEQRTSRGLSRSMSPDVGASYRESDASCASGKDTMHPELSPRKSPSPKGRHVRQGPRGGAACSHGGESAHRSSARAPRSWRSLPSAMAAPIPRSTTTPSYATMRGREVDHPRRCWRVADAGRSAARRARSGIGARLREFALRPDQRAIVGCGDRLARWTTAMCSPTVSMAAPLEQKVVGRAIAAPVGTLWPPRCVGD